MNENLIEQFVSPETIEALKTILDSDVEDTVATSASKLADETFGAGSAFTSIADKTTDAEDKLISSFHNNMLLLIQKTWVEQSDADLKASVLYKLDEFIKEIKQKDYTKLYQPFFDIVNNTVYLMFGVQTKAKDFADYALRIDPEFGIFWWYITSLPEEASTWSPEKIRIAILLGMYFLANY